MAEIGHNSGVAGKKLRKYIRRIENVTDEIKALTEDRAEIYKEAAADGFDTKILRKVIALRKMDVEAREEMQRMMDLYLAVSEGD